ncbi:MAG: glycosyltransferase [Thermaerobacter sp.]|nr:glycosyltransferase [Thermaerobacter sp.]
MRVTVKGPVYDASGYAELTRQVAVHLEEQGVEVALRAVPWGYAGVELDPPLRRRLECMGGRPEDPRGPVIYVSVANFFERVPGRPCIGYTMLEVDRIPPLWVERCNDLDEVWVPSSFNLGTFRASGVAPERLQLMPVGVDTRRFHPGLAPVPLPGRASFNFLSSFEWVPRKGYDLLLAAYAGEFRREEDVCLFIKAYSNGPDFDPRGEKIRREMERLLEPFPRPPRVVLLPGMVSVARIGSVYTAVDCYVSASRGEGWNLPAAEAMACARPCILPAWSAPGDFVDAANGYPVAVAGLERVPPCDHPNDQIYAGSRWARPDPEALKAAMRWVFTHPAQVRETGRRAAADMARLDWRKVAPRMVGRLKVVAGDA